MKVRVPDSIGFTGTRHGMSEAQRYSVYNLMLDLKAKGYKTAHHGICRGADAEFHHFARAFGLRIIGHPGMSKNLKCFTRANVLCDELRPEKRFTHRDLDIVLDSDVMIATPQYSEEILRSGTWTTIRYARRHLKPLYLVLPNGTIQKENGAE